MTPSANLSLSLLMFVSGIGIPVMAALNSGLGARLGSPWAATFLLFVIAMAAAGVAMLIMGLPQHGWFNAAPSLYVGGLLVAFYALAITWSAPRIGVANAVFFVLIGQIFAASLIDHYGLFGAVQSPITLRRAAGIALMLAGTYFARRIA